MKRLVVLIGGLLLAASFSLAAPGKDAAGTYVGSIGDSMCGAKHMMPVRATRIALSDASRGIEVHPD